MVTRRQFSREFKVEAVKLVTERGVGVSQATDEFPGRLSRGSVTANQPQCEVKQDAAMV